MFKIGSGKVSDGKGAITPPQTAPPDTQEHPAAHTSTDTRVHLCQSVDRALSSFRCRSTSAGYLYFPGGYIR